MSLLSVAPNSFTGMLTIPKPIDPLQIALAIAPPCSPGHRGFSTPRRAYPQVYQHNLLISNDLRHRILAGPRNDCCGMSHTGIYGAAEPSAGLVPLSARRTFFMPIV